MVESYKPTNKRQKVTHIHPAAQLKEKTETNEKKSKKGEDNSLVNVNVEEYKSNPEAFEVAEKKEIGA